MFGSDCDHLLVPEGTRIILLGTTVERKVPKIIFSLGILNFYIFLTEKFLGIFFILGFFDIRS